MQRISVTKCQGTGNDFVLFDARRHTAEAYASLAKFLCDRHFGVGADGLLVVSQPGDAGADLRMQIFNADGSEAESCGNGVRCVARYMWEQDRKTERLRITTLGGLIETSIVPRRVASGVRVAMREPQFANFPGGHSERRVVVGNEEAAAYIVSMGNPHVAIFVEQDTTALDLAPLAQQVEEWHLFEMPPNVELVRLVENTISMRVHERGVGETLGCGTGACAVAAAAIAYRHARSPLSVSSQGGSVKVDWAGPGRPAILTGGAAIVFQAEVVVPDEIPLSAITV